MFFPTEKELLTKAKKKCIEKVEKIASDEVDSNSENLKQQAIDAGLDKNEVEQFIQELKKEIKEEAVEKFLSKAKKIDNEYSNEPLLNQSLIR